MQQLNAAMLQETGWVQKADASSRGYADLRIPVPGYPIEREEETMTVAVTAATHKTIEDELKAGVKRIPRVKAAYLDRRDDSFWQLVVIADFKGAGLAIFDQVSELANTVMERYPEPEIGYSLYPLAQVLKRTTLEQLAGEFKRIL